MRRMTMAKNWPAEKSSWEVRLSRRAEGILFFLECITDWFCFGRCSLAAPANYYIAPRWTRTSWETSGECSHVHTRDTTERKNESVSMIHPSTNNPNNRPCCCDIIPLNRPHEEQTISELWLPGTTLQVAPTCMLPGWVELMCKSQNITHFNNRSNQILICLWLT